ncbi:PAS domain-containing protein [Chaetomium strumarium]|uniref:PAS domain-containing protein n=1 Tax=Chaetomium strumarium TaxID=1170767 RepID=A0AAJ0M1I2_9PEZI|nr:PAS domain-containing protein [Chaetomium strumarium]
MLQSTQQVQDQVPGMLNTTGLGEYGHANPLSATPEGLSLAEGDPLDDMVGQDNPELRRRRSISHPFSEPIMPPQSDDPSMSMMGFSSSGNAFDPFSFGNLGAPHNTMAGLGGFASTAGLPSSSVPFSQPGLVAMPGQGEFGTLVPDSMDMAAFSNLGLGPVTSCSATGGLWRCPDLPATYPPANLDVVSTDFAMDTDMGDDSPFSGFGLGPSGGIMGQREGFDNTPVPQEPPLSLRPTPDMSQFQTAVSTPGTQARSGPASIHSPAASGIARAVSRSSAGRSSSHAGTPGSLAPSAASQGPRKAKKDIYAPSGFPMLQVLANVVNRKNPQVEIGAVDLSCAFVVCDLTMNDCPIVYVSDNFQNLTGYNLHEIEGQNCRFLQSPDGKVEAGSKREFVDNDAVFKMRKAIQEGKEIQQSIINYRKGGKPFLNLLTMIPIPWEDSNGEMKYCVGFQMDLVECPDAISGQESGGSMQVNYLHSKIDRYIVDPPSSTHFDPESGQTLSVEEVTQLLEQHNPGGQASEWHRQSWDKMLLENADDVIHVLSLKGLFLYLSPACKRILEWDTAELVGASLSSVCHPSDIVSVTRELKEARQDSSIDVAFRIRRKHSGFTWFESHGALHYDQSKGRKYIVLVGRKRPVLSIRRSVVEAHSGGIGAGEAEIWSKMSPSGLFLFVSSSAHRLLDLKPRDLEGTSMQELLKNKESLDEFGRTIEKARRGQVVGFKHEILHRRGQMVPAYTFFYPGDAAGDGQQRCSFLIAQIKVAKAATRPIAGSSKVGGGSSLAVVVPFEDISMGRVGSQAAASARVEELKESEDDEVFAELSTTRVGSWQYELRQMEKVNRLLAEELNQLTANKKKRKRRNGVAGGSVRSKAVRDCANCHRRDTPEWRRGPSGKRDLCNSCGLRWAKQQQQQQQQQQTGKVSPRSRAGSGDAQASKRSSISSASTKSPAESSPLRREVSADAVSVGSSGMERGSLGDAAGSAMEMSSIREE